MTDNNSIKNFNQIIHDDEDGENQKIRNLDNDDGMMIEFTYFGQYDNSSVISGGQIRQSSHRRNSSFSNIIPEEKDNRMNPSSAMRMYSFDDIVQPSGSSVVPGIQNKEEVRI